MTFADVGDRLTLTPGKTLEFVIEGEFAEGLSAGANNLVTQARDAVLAAAGRRFAFRLTLTKNLPLAAGLGGGTSDAAAALRLVAAAASSRLGERVLGQLASKLGADGPACLRARTLVAEGRGERLRPAPRMPVLDAVLVNPRVASPTPKVYAAFDRQGRARAPDRFPVRDAFQDPFEVAEFLRSCRNDLEAPAQGLVGEIGEVLRLLGGQEETLIARLSGSGATCFALCPDATAARRLSARVQADRPRWWVRPCRLGGSPPARPAPPLRAD